MPEHDQYECDQIIKQKLGFKAGSEKGLLTQKQTYWLQMLSKRVFLCLIADKII